MKGDVKLNTLNRSPPDTFVLLSNNPGKPHKGGTCFGDSGGPTFDHTTSTLVMAVTSFGFSSTCSGIGGAYRLDQPDDLAFLASLASRPSVSTDGRQYSGRPGLSAHRCLEGVPVTGGDGDPATTDGAPATPVGRLLRRGDRIQRPRRSRQLS